MVCQSGLWGERTAECHGLSVPPSGGKVPPSEPWFVSPAFGGNVPPSEPWFVSPPFGGNVPPSEPWFVSPPFGGKVPLTRRVRGRGAWFPTRRPVPAGTGRRSQLEDRSRRVVGVVPNSRTGEHRNALSPHPSPLPQAGGVAPLPTPNRRSVRRKNGARRTRYSRRSENPTTLPSGSFTDARRSPQGRSTGSSTAVAPSSMQRWKVASRSSTVSQKLMGPGC